MIEARNVRITTETMPDSPRPSRRLDLCVQYASDAPDLPTRAQLRAWTRAALDVDGPTKPRGGQITLRFVDAEEGQMLNREYRDKDYATNVLTFPYEIEPRVYGDIVICAPVVAREAAEQGKPLTAHYTHLVIHGVLHLLGHDHETSDADADAMEACERTLLAGFGLPDPYAAGQSGAH